MPAYINCFPVADRRKSPSLKKASAQFGLISLSHSQSAPPPLFSDPLSISHQRRRVCALVPARRSVRVQRAHVGDGNVGTTTPSGSWRRSGGASTRQCGASSPRSSVGTEARGQRRHGPPPMDPARERRCEQASMRALLGICFFFLHFLPD